MERVKLNPTCIFSGKKENLVMKAHRNENGDMVGWIFVAEEYADLNIAEYIEWKMRYHNEDKPMTNSPSPL